MKLKRTLGFLLILIGSFGLAACPESGPLEEAGESMDDAAEEAGDALEDAVDEVEDAAD